MWGAWNGRVLPLPTCHSDWHQGHRPALRTPSCDTHRVQGATTQEVPAAMTSDTGAEASTPSQRFRLGGGQGGWLSTDFSQSTGIWPHPWGASRAKPSTQGIADKQPPNTPTQGLEQPLTPVHPQTDVGLTAAVGWLPEHPPQPYPRNPGPTSSEDLGTDGGGEQVCVTKSSFQLHNV